MPESVINQHLQDCFLFLSITDTSFLSAVRSYVSVDYFTHSLTKFLVGLCYGYYDKYKECPKNHFHDEIVKYLDNKSDTFRNDCYDYIEKIVSIEQPNKEYLLESMSSFVQAREFQETAVKFVQLVDKGKFDDAKYLMQNCLRKSLINNDDSYDYFYNIYPTYYLKEEHNDYIPFGIEPLDKYFKDLKKGRFVCILGGHKGKKSWFAMHIALQAILQGRNVLHVSHEMQLDQVEQRYDMMLGGLANDKDIEKVSIRLSDNAGEIVDEYEKEVKHVWNIQEVKRVRNIYKKFGGRLIIKKYPPNTCSIMELERYLDKLRDIDNFVPDLLINDYADIMKLGGGQNTQTRDKINECYLQHKKIADERNILVITISQSNREGTRSSFIGRSNFAEDIRKLGNVDAAVAISQTNRQAQEQEARVYVLASRSGRDDYGCYIRMNLDIGQFCYNAYENSKIICESSDIGNNKKDDS